VKWTSLLLALAAVLALAVPAESQSLVANYYRCSTADEGEADFIMNAVFADVYQAHVDSGDLIAWGWVEHTIGGDWRRISTITAEDRSTATRVWGEIVAELEDEHPNALHRFNEICDSHDDYIWTVTDSYEGTDQSVSPPAWVSIYFTCDQQAEARADELMAEMSGVIDKHVEAGHLGGWGWYSHDLGGWFRRLWTLTGVEDFDVLDGRQMVIDELLAEHADAFAEFGSICSGHVDYMWSDARATDGG
jgi:hypothetical protein